ncbi:general amino acid permease agp2 [Ophiostoma piceae UAMH 11346]|uniref:General amino acid permease agp2 n=1 Tax=Ophiostoma piceae (strain UAMH 11346) TaxID=1262450 RepID=S3D6T6_OPHP1|nr:general amino acid permease agp2 [Ophiostoma piceae UAMH 11346]
MAFAENEKATGVGAVPGATDGPADDSASSIDISDHKSLHRQLTNRQIQLFAIGGSIGTSVFVVMGTGLASGGPLALLLAYAFYSFIVGLVTNCEAEMAVFMPVNAAFIRHAGKWIDPAWGFMVGWNYFFYIGVCIPLEITAVSLILQYWTDKIPTAAVIVICIIFYISINVFAVDVYGETEFWLASGKVILLLIVFCFTFITMVGGNPQRDAYGFRNWTKPGVFVPYIDTGSLGKFEGFLSCLFQASYVVAGPDYLSIVAGEVKHPRRALKAAFKTMYLRFGVIFIGSALAIGIVVAANDPALVDVVSGNTSTSTAAASPYVIAMNNMGISVLPSFCNALLLTSIFSAGNSYTYATTRSLYGLAVDGYAPRFLTRCTAKGIPVYCLAVAMLFSALAFLQLGNGSNTVLHWIINVATAGGLIDYITITLTYLCFRRALQVQGIDRATLPYKGWFQPYQTYFAMGVMFVILFTYGYTAFYPWSVGNFFIYYSMLLVAPCTFTFWKVYKKTKFVQPHEADLVWDRPIIDAYESTLEPEAGFWTEVGHIFLIGRTKQQSVA